MPTDEGTPAPSVAPGIRLGPYEILSPLGAGAMGEVWKARDTRLGREVAVKLLPPSFVSSPDRVARFAREARVLAQLRHPGIAAVHSFEEIDGYPLLVMELAEGETLARRIAAGPLPPEEAIPIARQIAEALEEAHEKGIVHRDLKPGNVKVSPKGRVKLLDFGLAITWSHGDVFSARLAPDGQNVVYSAAFDGRPLALYSARLDAIESRPLDLPAGDVVGISRGADMALLVGRHNVGSWKRVGTLAQASLSGGSPRPVLEEVFDADIAPDGQSFAVVRAAHPGQQLEFPIGRVVHRSRGWISDPRISADGGKVAFLDHDVDGDDLGSVSLFSGAGPAARLSPQLDYAQGLAWSPSGEEIWGTSYRVEEGTLLQAFSPSHPPKVLMRVPSTARILDVAPDGRILMTYDDTHVELEGRLAGDPAIRSYSWWRASFVTGISHDGALFAGDGAMNLEQGGSAAFYRRAGNTPPVRLGAGSSAGVSPDGRWVFLTPAASLGTRLRAVPTGPGEPREFDLAPVESMISGTRVLSFSSDGGLLSFVGAVPGSDLRGYPLETGPGGVPRAVTPEGVDEVVLSPDGRTVAGVARGKGIWLFPTGNGEGRSLAGTEKDDLPVAWASSSRALFVWDRRIPLRVFRVDLETGKRTLALSMEPRDPTGILYGHVHFTPDLSHFLFRFRRHTSYLSLVSGAR